MSCLLDSHALLISTSLDPRKLKARWPFLSTHLYITVKIAHSPNWLADEEETVAYAWAFKCCDAQLRPRSIQAGKSNFLDFSFKGFFYKNP